MKSLYLLRHAKSSWKDSRLADRDRPLNKRGRRDAPRIGAALSERFPPMVFHVSPARRAQLTFDGLKSGWRGLTDVHRQTDEALYTFDAGALLTWLASRPEPAPGLAVIGHNPALTDLANTLVGRQIVDNLPTAGWLALSLPIESWSQCLKAPVTAALELALFPRQLNPEAH